MAILLAGLSCTLGGEIHGDLSSLYPENGLNGWHINETNTGLCGKYTGLAELDPSEAGYVAYGTLFITINGATISHKEINYPVNIQAEGVTIEQCLIRPYSCGRGVPVVIADNAIIRDSEIDCENIPLEQVGFSIVVNGDNFIIERCNIHGGSSGISIGSTADTMVSVAQGNYVHGLRLYTDPDTNETAHIDGLTIRRSDGLGVIIRNNFILVQPDIATGPLFIQAWRGHINNVLVQGNLLQGHGFCLALEYNAYGYGNNMRAVNNRIDPWTDNGSGPWYAYVSGGQGWYIWDNNYSYNSGAVYNIGSAVPAP